MEVNSVEQLCTFLISCAFQRCRILDDLCRLSVSVKPAPPLLRISDLYWCTDYEDDVPQMCDFEKKTIFEDALRISDCKNVFTKLSLSSTVSDTGVGSTLEEFQVLKYENDPIWASKWGLNEFLMNDQCCSQLINDFVLFMLPYRAVLLPFCSDVGLTSCILIADGFLFIATTNTAFYMEPRAVAQVVHSPFKMVNQMGSRSTISPTSSIINQIRFLLSKGIPDKEIHHLKLDLKEVVSSRRLMRLTSTTKNGAKFSGTEVSLSVYEEGDGVVTMLSLFIQKMLILKSPKIAVELTVESGGNINSQPENIVWENPCRSLPMHAENIDYLKLALEDYVSRHGNRLAEACHSCFSSGKNLKVGTGIACSKGNQQSGRQVMEVVIIISEITIPQQSSHFRLYGRTTEVLYYKDFLPCSISQSSLDALTSIDWKKYGLVLKSVGEQDGVTLLEWENLPPSSHIDIVLHRYHKQYPRIYWKRFVTTLLSPENNQIDRLLTRKAVKLALTELKEKNAGVLLSERAVKICRYAPDLAKSISGLILSSHDLKFQAECLSLLGLQSQEIEKNMIENCIKDKITSVIASNDRNSWGSREVSTLFSDDSQHASYGPDEECEEGEEAFNYLDL
ncbi:hypothetical protein OROGR_028518 [Orobanche gracilis]